MKTARLEIRMTEEQKIKMSQAAKRKGVPVSSLALDLMIEGADEILAENHVTYLTEADFTKLLTILSSPPAKPTEYLLESLRMHKEIVQKG